MRLACVQTDVALGDPIANAESLTAHVADLARRGVDLAVFPESYLTGYVVNSAEEAQQIAITDDHDAHRRVEQAVREFGVGVCYGYARSVDGRLTNSARTVLPDGAVHTYEKTHLPYLGYDRFATVGDRLTTFATPWGRVAMMICYDLRFPEAARTLALAGADLILLPTNWPRGAETSAQHMSIARAAENLVFLATANRVGIENGAEFIGHSRIIAPGGRVLAAADHDQAAVVIADIDLGDARRKTIVNRPGEYELRIWEDRRPDLYRIG